jgi:hypothetical protein
MIAGLAMVAGWWVAVPLRAKMIWFREKNGLQTMTRASWIRFEESASTSQGALIITHLRL